MTEAGLYTNLNYQNVVLKGEIPLEFQYLTSLRRISIPDMKLTGPLLSYINGMPLLETLTVPKNRFTGSFSPTFAEDHPLLSYVDLSANLFNGTLPEHLGTLAFLTELQLPQNRFSGPIPSGIGNSSMGKRFSNG